MRVTIQRVSQASVKVDNKIVSSISKGLLILLGIEDEDNKEDVEWLTGKISKLRIFPDDKAPMNQSVINVNGDILVVSQFTLFASTKKGNRPSFTRSGDPNFAKDMYELFLNELSKKTGKIVQKGVFAANMKVSLINDGPVTINIDSRNRE